MGDPTPELLDAHLYPEGLSDHDLESLSFFGVTHALVLAPPEPVEPTARKLLHHLDALVGVQLRRLERAGLRGFAAVGVHPRSLPRRGLHEVLAALPGYFRGGRVVALGEVGLHSGSEGELEALAEQLALARRLKVGVVASTPNRRKEPLTRLLLARLKESGVPPARVLVDRVDGRNVRSVLGRGHFAGLTVHPGALTAEAAVELVRRHGAERLVLGSDAGLGAGDLLSLPRVARLLTRARLSPEVVARVARKNALRFLAPGGR